MRVVFEGVLYSRAGSVTGFTVCVSEKISRIFFLGGNDSVHVEIT